MELYEILQVEPDCSMANIKKSYYKQNSKKIGEYREYEKLTNTSDSNNTNTNTYLKILCNYVDNMLHGKYIIYDKS